MAREEKIIGGCPKCSSARLVCKYNRFESDDLRIDSWEHRCPDCGHRETQAIRSDDEDAADDRPSTQCPFCGRATAV